MLEVRNISKEFPGVRALDNVSMRFEKGTIHALIGGLPSVRRPAQAGPARPSGR